MSRKLIAVLILVCFLGGCGVTPVSQNSDGFTMWGDYEVKIEGNRKTDDNPWGYIAGVIDDDELGEVVLLNPNTSITFRNLSGDEKIEMEIGIYPLVASASDGAGLDVWFMKDDDIIDKSFIDVANDSSWKDIKFSVKDYPMANGIKILCNNGKNDNDECDWVILKLK